MATTNITVYLSEDDYKKYIKDKENYNTIAREALKKALEKRWTKMLELNYKKGKLKGLKGTATAGDIKKKGLIQASADDLQLKFDLTRVG